MPSTAVVQTDEQTCAEFANLMDHIYTKKQEVRRDLHIREDFVPFGGKAFKSSAFIAQKSQGGGYYPSTADYNKTCSLMDFRNSRMPSSQASSTGI